ncbi:MAG: hypothetical protein V8S98_08295 [Lachnospiraceae bacterium]
MKTGVTATLNFQDATIKNGNSDGRYNVLNLEAGAHVTLNLKERISSLRQLPYLVRQSMFRLVRL